jgi:stage V sporulation protein G
MPTQSKTGARPPQRAASPPKQAQEPPSLKAGINWMNPDEEGAIRATASLTIGGAFAVHGIKIIDGSKGQFVSMPSYRSGESYKDIFHAVSAEAREQMNEAVLAAYNQKLAEIQEQAQDVPDEGEGPDESADAPDESAEEGQVLKM